jgi:hypothetical protein
MDDTIIQPETEMPVFDPALMSEDGFLALAAQQVTEEAPAAPIEAAPVAPAPEPVVPIVEPAQPVVDPAPAVETPAAPDALRPDLAKNYRVTAQTAVEQTALQIRRADPSLSLLDAVVRAHEELGLPSPLAVAPQAPAPTPPTPAPAAVSPVDKIKAELATLDAELEDTHPSFDAEKFRDLTRKRQDILTEQMRLEMQAQITERFESQNSAHDIAATEQVLHEEYGEVLANPNHLFTKLFRAEEQNLLATAPDEVVGAADFELQIARRIEAQLAEHHISVRQKPAASAPVAPAHAPVTQQPAPAAAPQPTAPAAQPRSAAVPLSGASASVNPVMGIDRPDPTASISATLQSPGAITDADAFGDQMLAAVYGGHVAPAPASLRMAA